MDKARNRRLKTWRNMLRSGVEWIHRELYAIQMELFIHLGTPWLSRKPCFPKIGHILRTHSLHPRSVPRCQCMNKTDNNKALKLISMYKKFCRLVTHSSHTTLLDWYGRTCTQNRQRLLRHSPIPSWVLLVHKGSIAGWFGWPTGVESVLVSADSDTKTGTRRD